MTQTMNSGRTGSHLPTGGQLTMQTGISPPHYHYHPHGTEESATLFLHKKNNSDNKTAVVKYFIFWEFEVKVNLVSHFCISYNFTLYILFHSFLLTDLSSTSSPVCLAPLHTIDGSLVFIAIQQKSVMRMKKQAALSQLL